LVSASLPLSIGREVRCYPTPINLNYWYGIGLLLLFLLVNQVITGIQLASYYIVGIDVALSSVDYLLREIS
jgi:ubiquinol-cytochrome c reductase cytochrome b subunit